MMSSLPLALLMRAVFIAAGVTLMQKFHWIIYIFGAVLVNGIEPMLVPQTLIAGTQSFSLLVLTATPAGLPDARALRQSGAL